LFDVRLPQKRFLVIEFDLLLSRCRTVIGSPPKTPSGVGFGNRTAFRPAFEKQYWTPQTTLAAGNSEPGQLQLRAQVLLLPAAGDEPDPTSVDRTRTIFRQAFDLFPLVGNSDSGQASALQ